jgi:hypothetical protein|nr:MAG TPA: hypothetical protein [Caudoviricetes sp.]
MAKVTKTQVVKFIRKGEKGDPAVNIIVGSDTVVFTKSGQAAKITLQVFIGDRQLNYGDGTNDTFVCSTLGNSHYILDNNVYWTFKIESDNKTFDYLLSLQNKADLSAVLPFTITVNGISYSKTLTIKTVYDGTDGISVMLSQDNIVHKKSEYVSTYTINISLIDKVAVAPSGYSINIESFPVGITPQILQNGTDGYKLMVGIQPTATWDTTIPITLIITYGTYKITRLVYVSVIDNGEKGERGAVLRGPQDWNELGDGYQFYSGASGELYLDSIYYNGNFYLCKKSHTKSSLNYPGSTTDNNNGYWQLGDKIALVAATLLLAKYAVIKNLGAEGITMKDKEGNVVFKAEKGSLICKVGTFENVDVSGIVHASLMYSSVKSFNEQNTGSSMYNIDPINDPANTFYIVAATGHTKFMNLPDANTYEGLELNFYQTILTTAAMGDIYVAAASSQYIYYNTVGRLINENTVPVKISPASRDTRIKISANEVIRLKAMNGAWYVMTGLVTEE